jgi:hypothetical protein
MKFNLKDHKELQTHLHLILIRALREEYLIKRYRANMANTSWLIVSFGAPELNRPCQY